MSSFYQTSIFQIINIDWSVDIFLQLIFLAASTEFQNYKLSKIAI